MLTYLNYTYCIIAMMMLVLLKFRNILMYPEEIAT